MTVYTINCYNETNSHPRFDFFELFETEELAIKRLQRYAKEIKAGKWYNCTFLEWHDADVDEVTWLRYSRKSHDGPASTMRLCIEECPMVTE